MVRILLVSAISEEQRDLYSEVLTSAGHQVECASSGPEAMEDLLKMAPFHLVIIVGSKIGESMPIFSTSLSSDIRAAQPSLPVMIIGSEVFPAKNRECNMVLTFLEPMPNGLLTPPQCQYFLAVVESLTAESLAA